MGFVKAKWMGVALVISAAAAFGAGGQPMDARVSSTNGQSVWMARLWGKPSVIFYEDKDGSAQNQPLKDALFKKGKEKGLLDSVSVVAIANVRGFDWFPAKGFVISAVKKTEKTAGIPVYLDWTGVMSSQPWSLSATGSTVLVVDAAGEQVLFSKEGALSPEEIDQVFELLGSLVGR